MKLYNIIQGTGALVGSISKPVINGGTTIISKTANYAIPRTTQVIESFMTGYHGATKPAPTVKQLELALEHAKELEAQL